MYSDPGFIVSVGAAAFIILFGLFNLVAARLRAGTMRVLEWRGRAIAVEITDIRFKALNQLGDSSSSYGLVSFTYEYEGKVYERKQALAELIAQDLLKRSSHPCVLVLPEKPRYARLAYNERMVYDDPIIGRDTRAGIGMIFFAFFILGIVVVISMISH